MKLRNSKGFTLMEMLIVVAIIGVLVAVAIPTFSDSLNKSKVAADKANISNAYSQYMAAYTLDPDAAVAVEVGPMQADATSETVGELTGLSWEKGESYSLGYDDNGVIALEKAEE